MTVVAHIIHQINDIVVEAGYDGAGEASLQLSKTYGEESGFQSDGQDSGVG